LSQTVNQFINLGQLPAEIKPDVQYWHNGDVDGIYFQTSPSFLAGSVLWTLPKLLTLTVIQKSQMKSLRAWLSKSPALHGMQLLLTTPKSTHCAFHQQCVDHAHEQLNAAIKSEGGALSLTGNDAALSHWAVTAPDVARI